MQAYSQFEFEGCVNGRLLASVTEQVNAGKKCFDAKLPALKKMFVKTDDDAPHWDEFLGEIREAHAREEDAMKQVLWEHQQTLHELEMAMQWHDWQTTIITDLLAYGKWQHEQLCNLKQKHSAERWRRFKLGACYSWTP